MRDKKFLFFSAIFILWSGWFIWKSSFVGMDGARQFCLIDDAMISMKYAKNCAGGHGLVWNPGERVEGYSNPLMTFLMTVFFLLSKKGAILGVQIAGMMAVLVAAAVNAKIAGKIGRWPLGAFVFTLFYYPMAYWPLMGHEAGLIALFVSCAVLFALHGHASLAGISMGLAFWTRMDAAIFLVPVILLLKKTPLKLRAASAASLLMAGLILFQKLYYGHYVPNTYFLKLTGVPIIDRLRDGMVFAGPFLLGTAPLLIFGLRNSWKEKTESLILILIFAAVVAYEIWVGGDNLPYWRILCPAVPMLAIAALKPKALTALLTCLIGSNLMFMPELLMAKRPAQADMSEFNAATGMAIREVTEPGATVGLFWAGAIAYFSERNGIDFYGKMDTIIARMDPVPRWSNTWGGLGNMPGHNKFNLEYSIKKLRPTYVQSFRRGGQDLSAWASENYVTRTYRGIPLNLDRLSPFVRWDLLDPL